MSARSSNKSWTKEEDIMLALTVHKNLQKKGKTKSLHLATKKLPGRSFMAVQVRYRRLEAKGELPKILSIKRGVGRPKKEETNQIRINKSTESFAYQAAVISFKSLDKEQKISFLKEVII